MKRSPMPARKTPLRAKSPKRHRVVVSGADLRNMARGKPCQVRIPGICNGNPETTVLAHYRMPGICGTGIKPSDVCGAWSCSACHDAIDGRTSTPYTRDELRLMHAEGCLRTLAQLDSETP